MATPLSLSPSKVVHTTISLGSNRHFYPSNKGDLKITSQIKCKYLNLPSICSD